MPKNTNQHTQPAAAKKAAAKAYSRSPDSASPKARSSVVPGGPRLTSVQTSNTPSNNLPGPMASAKSIKKDIVTFQLKKLPGVTRVLPEKDFTPHLRLLLAQNGMNTPKREPGLGQDRNIMLHGYGPLQQPSRYQVNAAMLSSLTHQVLNSKWGTLLAFASQTASVVNALKSGVSEASQLVNLTESALGLDQGASLKWLQETAKSLISSNEGVTNMPVNPSDTVLNTVMAKSPDGGVKALNPSLATSKVATMIAGEAQSFVSDANYRIKYSDVQVFNSDLAPSASTVGLAQAKSMKGKHTITHVLETKYGSAIVVKTKQPIARVVSPAAVNNPWILQGLGTTNVTQITSLEGGGWIQISPDSIGGAAAIHASRYERYHLLSAEFEFVTSTSALQTGMFGHCVSDDPTSSSAFPALNYEEAGTFEDNHFFPVYKGDTLSYHCTDMGDYLFTTRYSDPRLVEAGAYALVSAAPYGGSLFNQPHGVVWLTAHWILTAPTPDNGITIDGMVRKYVSSPVDISDLIRQNPLPLFEMLRAYGVSGDTPEDDLFIKECRRYNLLPAAPCDGDYDTWLREQKKKENTKKENTERAAANADRSHIEVSSQQWELVPPIGRQLRQ